MKKLIIGIIPTIKRNEDDPYKYKYTFLNSYSKMIIKNGAIPIGLLLNDGNINNDILNICDAFIFPGGNKLEQVHFDVLLHAIQYNKPILGICLGMQVLNYFSILKDILNRRNLIINKENLWNIFNEVKNEYYFKLKDINTPNIHGYEIMQEKIECNLDNLSKSKHNINIYENSILYNIYKEKNINVLSLHLKQVINVGSDFYISANADDGVIEAIEYKDKDYFIIGVQYHPELNDNKLFKYFIKEVKKRHV